MRQAAMAVVAMASVSLTRPTLEDLAFAYATDKSHDDHKYTDLYSMLLDPLRDSTTNITEVGIASGQSLWMWHEYFSLATVWGLDLRVSARLREVFGSMNRVHLLTCDATSPEALAAVGFANESMDIIVDDGLHEADANQRVLLNMWPLLRPGGLYFMEDITTGSFGRTNGKFSPEDASYPVGESPLTHDDGFLDVVTRNIFAVHGDVFFADTLVGHRAYDEFKERMGPGYIRSRVNHNSHLLVIRKRRQPRVRPIQINFGLPGAAMSWVPNESFVELSRREARQEQLGIVPRVPQGFARGEDAVGSKRGDQLRRSHYFRTEGARFLQRSRHGHCGNTPTRAGNCSEDESGSFGLWPQTARSWRAAAAVCLEACSRCEGCYHVSVSIRWADCSWYRKCPRRLFTDTVGFLSAAARQQQRSTASVTSHDGGALSPHEYT